MALPPHGDPELRARRRRASRLRRRRLARVDVVVGLIAAIVLLLASPGLAIAGIVALLLLIGAGISLLVAGWSARRAARKAQPSSPSGASHGDGDPTVDRR